jgi:hypothetical protein
MLDKGSIIAEGSYAALMETSAEFKMMCELNSPQVVYA